MSTPPIASPTSRSSPALDALLACALLCCPPVGIVLVWLLTKWSRSAKIAASAASGGLFLLVMLLSAVGRVAPAPAQPPFAPPVFVPMPVPVTTPLAVGPTAGPVPVPGTVPLIAPPTGATIGTVPGAVPSTAGRDEGPALVREEPRLLVPRRLEGFVLQAIEPHPSSIGVTAKYIEASYDDVKVEVRLRKVGEALPEPDDRYRVTTVDDHPAVLSEDNAAEEKQVLLQWRAAGWHFAVAVLYSYPRNGTRARRLAPEIAARVAEGADRYLAGGTPPPAAERQANIDALDAATGVLRLSPGTTRPDVEIVPQPAKLDRLGGTLMADFLFTNRGNEPARIGNCTVTFGNDITCMHPGPANVQVTAFTQSPPGRRRRRLIGPLTIPLYQEHILLPGGEASVWRKIFLSRLVGCNLANLPTRVRCEPFVSVRVAGWPPGKLP
jgi:hypothetical protein